MKTGNKKSKHPIVKITLLSIIVIVIIAGIKECWLDFNQIPKETELAKQIGQPMYMGSLGEGYAFYMRLYPSSYRKYRISIGVASGTKIIPSYVFSGVRYFR